MDATRFDSLARSLTVVRSRRGAFTTLLGGTLGLLGFTDTAARKGKKKKKRKKPGQHPTSPMPVSPVSPVSPPPPPPPVGPTCSDGIQNGTETDVDCGGTCPRCANAMRCKSRNDCESALCSVFGYCYACTVDADCGSDGGGSCGCAELPAAARYCQQIRTAASCPVCPDGTLTCGTPLGFAICTRLCGT